MIVNRMMLCWNALAKSYKKKDFFNVDKLKTFQFEFEKKNNNRENIIWGRRGTIAMKGERAWYR